MAILSTFSAAWKNLRTRFGALLVYEIYFRLLSAAAIGPVMAGLLAYLISTSGQLAIGNEQIAAFLLSPVGLIGGLLVGGLWSAATFAEHVGLIAIGLAAESGQPLSATAALWRMLKKFPGVLQLGLLYFAGFAAVAAPFLGLAGLTYWLLLSSHDINFYLAEQPPVWFAALTIGGGLAAGLAAAWAALYVRWIFALPILLVEDLPAWSCLRTSAKTVAGQRLRCGRVPLLWLLLMAGVSLLTGLLLDGLDDLLLSLVADQPRVAVLATLLIVAAELFVGAALSFIGLSIHCLLIARMYHVLRAPAVVVPQPTPASPVSPQQRRRQRLLIWSLVGVELIVAAGITAALIGNLPMNDRVEVTAHRGSSLVAPENSMAAFAQAIADGADYIELDVQETADGELVVLHDADLARIAGLKRGIWEVTFAEVQNLDIGSHFNPKFSSERLLTLRQVIELVRGKAKLNIEMKFNGHDRRLAEKTVEVVRQEQFLDQCVITSLKFEGVAEVRRLEPRLKIGFIVAQAIGDITRLDCDLLSVNHSRVSDKLLAEAAAGHKAVHAWTVNDRTLASTLIDRGVNNLITDDPVMIRNLLRERADLTNAERTVLAIRSFLGR